MGARIAQKSEHAARTGTPVYERYLRTDDLPRGWSPVIDSASTF